MRAGHDERAHSRVPAGWPARLGLDEDRAESGQTRPEEIVLALAVAVGVLTLS